MGHFDKVARADQEFLLKQPSLYMANTGCRNPLLAYRIAESYQCNFAIHLNSVSTKETAGARRSVVVKALCCKPEGRGFLPAVHWPWGRLSL
jgi:hypothetical protein